MPKVTFKLTRVLYVEVVGEKHPKGFPYVPNDGGLVQKLLQWFLKRDDMYSFRGISSGGGSYYAIHTLEQERELRKWLTENGATEVKS